MYDLPNNNIGFLDNNPIYVHNNFSALPVKQLVEEITNYKKKYGSSCPETDALKFYLTNHAIHVIKNKYKEGAFIPDDVKEFAKKCNDLSTRISKALFFHVSLVGHGMLWVGKLDQNQLQYFTTHYGRGFGEFLEKKGSSQKDFSSISSINMSIGQFLGGISSVFSFGKIIAWGKPYSNIIKVIERTSKGSYTLHTAADHIWSLCHNGGTVLNKGIGNVYNVATDYIFDILDVQDAGQIPQFVNENLKSGKANKYIDKELKELTEIFKKLFPNEFGPTDNKKIQDSYKKRQAAHAAMKKQYSAWWNMNNNIGNNNWNQPKDDTPIIPERKIDKILIDDFKKNKWI